jgi:hypothetical protein
MPLVVMPLVVRVVSRLRRMVVSRLVVMPLVVMPLVVRVVSRLRRMVVSRLVVMPLVVRVVSRLRRRVVPLVVRVVSRLVVMPLVVRVVSRLRRRVVPLVVRVVFRLRRMAVGPRVDYFPKAHHRVSSSIKVARVQLSSRNRQIQTVPRVWSSRILMSSSLHRLTISSPVPLPQAVIRLARTAPLVSLQGTAPLVSLQGTAPLVSLQGTAPLVSLQGTAPLVSLQGTVPLVNPRTAGRHLLIRSPARTASRRHNLIRRPSDRSAVRLMEEPRADLDRIPSVVS